MRGDDERGCTVYLFEWNGPVRGAVGLAVPVFAAVAFVEPLLAGGGGFVVRGLRIFLTGGNRHPSQDGVHLADVVVYLSEWDGEGGVVGVLVAAGTREPSAFACDASAQVSGSAFNADFVGVWRLGVDVVVLKIGR